MNFPKLKYKAILAPMAGITDVAFRALARDCKAGLTYTQLVSSAGIVRENELTDEFMKTDKSEKPSAVQLFGNDPKEIAESIEKIEDRFDIFDINCGCPAPRISKKGCGSALLKDPELISKIISKSVSITNKPVTIKIRSGISKNFINALDVAKIAEDSGASALTIHARTKAQGYSGEADWNLIKKVKEKLNIPVIGNGDITSPEIFKERLDSSGVDYIMVGRASIGRPYIFTQIDDFLKKGTYKKFDNIPYFFKYLDLAKKYAIPFFLIREQAMNFTKGIKNSTLLRRKLQDTRNVVEIVKVLQV